MAFNLEVFKDAAWDWIRAASGLPPEQVIFAHQDAPEPVGDYITITIIEDADTLGQKPEEGVNELGQVYTKEHWRIEGNFQIWGDNAQQLMLVMKPKLLLPSYYKILTDAGFGAHYGRAQFFPGLKTHQWEDSMKLDVVWVTGASSVDTGAPDESGTPQPIGYFDSVEYSGPEMEPRPVPSAIVTAPQN